MNRFFYCALVFGLPLTVCPPCLANETTWQVHDAAGWRALEEAVQDDYRPAQFKDTKELFERAIKEAEKIGANDYRGAISRVGLAWALSYTKQYEQVCKLVHQVLPLIQKIPDDSRRKTIYARALHVLGRAELCLCTWDVAVQQLQGARKAYQVLPNEREALVEVLLDLARLARCRLEMIEALQLFDEAFQNSQRPRIRNGILLERADILIVLGRYSKAGPIHDQWRKATEAAEAGERRTPRVRTSGPDERPRRPASFAEKHFEANVIFARLALLLGDLTKARALLLEVTSCDAITWKPHCDYQSDYWLLWTWIHAQSGHWDEAWSAFAKISPPPWRQIYFDVIKLELEGRRDFEDGHYEKAFATLERAVSCSDRGFGFQHPVSVNARLDLARIRLIQGRESDQPLASYCDQVLRIEEHLACPPAGGQAGAVRTDGDVHHPDAGRAMQILGNYYLFHHHYAAAMPLLEKSHNILSLALPTSHPERVMSIVHLARASWAQMRFEETQRLLDAASRLCDAGGNYTEVAASLKAARGWLALSQGHFEAALQHFVESIRTWECTPARQRNVSHPALEDALLGWRAAYFALRNDGEFSDEETTSDSAWPILLNRMVFLSIPFEYSRRASLIQKHGQLIAAKWFYWRAKREYTKLSRVEPPIADAAACKRFAENVSERIKTIDEQIKGGKMKMKDQ